MKRYDFHSHLGKTRSGDANNADQLVREEDIALLASLQKTGYNLIGAEKGIFVRKQGPGR